MGNVIFLEKLHELWWSRKKSQTKSSTNKIDKKLGKNWSKIEEGSSIVVRCLGMGEASDDQKIQDEMIQKIQIKVQLQNIVNFFSTCFVSKKYGFKLRTNLKESLNSLFFGVVKVKSKIKNSTKNPIKFSFWDPSKILAVKCCFFCFANFFKWIHESWKMVKCFVMVFFIFGEIFGIYFFIAWIWKSKMM